MKQNKADVAMAMIIGTCGIIIVGVQPLLLGALLSEKAISTVDLGMMANAEIALLAVGIVLGCKILTGSAYRIRLITSCALAAGANVASALTHGALAILASRAVAGLLEGVMVGVATIAIANAERPRTISGLFLFVCGPPTLALAYLIPRLQTTFLGERAGFWVLAGLCVVSVLSTPLIQREFFCRDEATRSPLIWTRPLALAFASMLLANAAFGACWAYVEPLAHSFNLDIDATATAVSIGIIGQFMGSGVVALVGENVPIMLILILASVGQIVAIICLLTWGNPYLFTAALTVFGFLWQGCAAFGIALVIELDSSKATAPFAFPLQLIGISLGPLAATAVVNSGIHQPFLIAIGALVIASILYVLIDRSSRTA